MSVMNLLFSNSWCLGFVLSSLQNQPIYIQCSSGTKLMGIGADLFSLSSMQASISCLGELQKAI